MMLLEPGGDEGVMESILQAFRDPGNSPYSPIYKALLYFLYLIHEGLASVFNIFLVLPEITLHIITCHG